MAQAKRHLVGRGSPNVSDVLAKASQCRLAGNVIRPSDCRAAGLQCDRGGNGGNGSARAST